VVWFFLALRLRMTIQTPSTEDSSVEDKSLTGIIILSSDLSSSPYYFLTSVLMIYIAAGDTW